MTDNDAERVAYISNLDEPVRTEIEQLDALISKALGDARHFVWTGKLWGGTEQTILAYGDWSYQRSDKKVVHWFMVGLAAQKNYLSVYINAVEDGQYVAKKYADKLGKVKIGSSSISFKKLSDLDLDGFRTVLEAAAEQISRH